MDMIIIVIIYLSHFFTHMHVQDAKRYLIRIVCVYCCAELVNLRHDSVYICVCVCVCTCESIWSWARGLQGENEWAHLPAVLCFKSFHSSVLQFYLWKITRNALYRLARLPDRASKTHIVSLCHCLLYFLLPPSFSSFLTGLPYIYCVRLSNASPSMSLCFLYVPCL